MHNQLATQWRHAWHQLHTMPLHDTTSKLWATWFIILHGLPIVLVVATLIYVQVQRIKRRPRTPKLRDRIRVRIIR